MIQKYTKKLTSAFFTVCVLTLAATFMYENKNETIALTIIGIFGAILLLLIFSDIKSLKIGSILEIERHNNNNNDNNNNNKEVEDDI